MQSSAQCYPSMDMDKQEQVEVAMALSHPSGFQKDMTSSLCNTSRPQTGPWHPLPAMAYPIQLQLQMQMQTPPPTRGSSVKKPQLQNVAFGTPSTIVTKRFASPHVAPQQTPNAYTDMAPLQHPQMQNFSPELYQFGTFGPASAPVLPQTPLLWDQTASSFPFQQQQQQQEQQQQQQQQQPRLDEPFAPTPSFSTMQWSQAPSPAFNTPAMNSFPVHTAVQRPASAVHLSHSETPFMAATSVDPSLVYSSPVQPPQQQPVERAAGRQPRLQESALPPASKRKDSGTADHSKNEHHKRTDAVFTSNSTASTLPSAGVASHPSLRRSNTTGTAGSHTAQTLSGMDSLGRRSSLLQVPRTASPLKRVGRPNLGSISESRKVRAPSVILTVDESGRAHAVRTEVPGLDSSTRAMRERYPGLYESDSSDDEDVDETESTPSRSASFSFSRGQERMPKAAKLDSSIESLDGLGLPRASLAISTKVAPSRAAISAAAQLRRGNSLRKRTPSRNGQRRVTNPSATSIDTAPMGDVFQDNRQSVIGSDDFDRGLTLSSRGSFELDAHNRRWSMMSLEQQQSISPTHPPQPSDTYFAQPAPRRQPRPQVRCMCSSTSALSSEQMIQCSSCTQFLHCACVGIGPDTVHPPKFTCWLCTRPTRLQASNRS